MSTTPEEIANELEDTAIVSKVCVSPEGGRIATYPLTEGAALIRVQAERVRVLERAASNLMTLVEPMVRGNTDFSVTWRKYVREMRAALKGDAP